MSRGDLMPGSFLLWAPALSIVRCSPMQRWPVYSPNVVEKVVFSEVRAGLGVVASCLWRKGLARRSLLL